jgi:hypothetical protein
VNSVRKVTLSLLAAWMLSGCAAMRLAYDNADTYMSWRASSYFSLAGDQAEELEERIDAFHSWHRGQALPKYAKLAEEAAKRLSDGLSPQDLVWGYDSVEAQARESLRAGAEKFAPLLDRIGPEQAAHIERGFADDNRKFAKENLRGSEQERRKRRTKRTVERLEDWVGKLSQAQIERVREYSERAPLYDELRDRDRKRLQAEVVDIVRSRTAQKRLAERAVNWREGRDPAYAAVNDAWREQYFAMLLDIDKSLSAEQRARAVSRFRSFAEDFTVLASRAGAENRSQ